MNPPIFGELLPIQPVPPAVASLSAQKNAQENISPENLSHSELVALYEKTRSERDQAIIKYTEEADRLEQQRNTEIARVEELRACVRDLQEALRSCLRFVEAFEPKYRNVEVDQQETLQNAQRLLNKKTP